MKVLSLIQPWATLIAIGEKKIETRSWKTNYRGEIAIHASKKIDKKVCEKEVYKNILNKYGYSDKNLPTGVILAKCTVKDIKRTEDLRNIIDKQEFVFGDYSDNRYGWLLDEVKLLDSPIQAKGRLGLWKFENL